MPIDSHPSRSPNRPWPASRSRRRRRAAKSGRDSRGSERWGGNRHQAADPQAVQFAQAQHRFLVLGQEPVLARLAADVHLEQAAPALRAAAGEHPVEPLRDLRPVDRLEHVEGGAGARRLVRLERPDQVPGDPVAVAGFEQRRPVRLAFLDPVLAEDPQARVQRPGDPLERLPLAGADQGDVRRPPARPPAGLRQPFRDLRVAVRGGPSRRVAQSASPPSRYRMRWHESQGTSAPWV